MSESGAAFQGWWAAEVGGGARRRSRSIEPLIRGLLAGVSRAAIIK